MKKNQKQKKVSQLYFKEIIGHINKILCFLFFLLLPTQLGKHFFLPISYLSGVRIGYLAPTLYVTDILALLLILLNIKIVLSVVRNKTFLIFAALSFVNILFALVQPIAAYKFLKVLEIIFIFFITAKQNLSEKLVLFAFLIGGSVELLLSLLQFVNKQSMQGVFYFLGERYFTLSLPDIAKASLYGSEILRPYGTFSHPNSMGGFHLLIYFFTLIYFKNLKLLKYSLLFVSSTLILLSFSKVAIGTYLILNVAFLIQQKFYRECVWCFVARISGLLVITFLFASAHGDVETVNKRLTLIKDSITIITSVPLFGVGFENYVVAQHGFAIRYPYFFLQPVHVIFLLLLAETGLILGGFILYKLFTFFKMFFRQPYILYILGVVILTGLFDHYWLTLQQNLLVLPVIFGLLASKDRTFLIK